MKQCSRCSNTLAADANFCYVCNSEQTDGFEDFEVRQHYSDTFLKVLCALTIVGAAFSIISSLNTLLKGNELEIAGMETLNYLGLGVALGKLAGAIFMLQKKLIGLYIYTAAAIVSTIIVVYSISLTSEYLESVDYGPAVMIVSVVFAVLFALAFLVMYWLPVNRRHLS